MTGQQEVYYTQSFVNHGLLMFFKRKKETEKDSWDDTCQSSPGVSLTSRFV